MRALPPSCNGFPCEFRGISNTHIPDECPSALVRRVRPPDIVDAWAQAMPPNHLGAWVDPQSEAIRDLATRFRKTVEGAVGHKLDRWHKKQDGDVALVILLDRFPRALWPGQRRSLWGDLHAQSIALQALSEGSSKHLSPEHRALLLLPLSNSEDEEMQARAVEGFARLAHDEGPVYRTLLEHALERQEVIEKFGRFPHRNGILERMDSPAESAWLATEAPGWAIPWPTTGSEPKAP